MNAPAHEVTPGPLSERSSEAGLLDRPPWGCSLQWEPDGGVARASERSWLAAGLLLPFSVLWNSIVIEFAAAWAGWMLRASGNQPAAWMPMMELGGATTWLLALFLLPFLVAGILLVLQLCLAVAGRTEVGRSGPDAWIRRSVGPVGWTRRFAAADVEEVRLATRHWRDSDGNARETTVVEVALRGGVVRRVGGTLKAERRAFLCVAARRVLGG
ncbi:MAG: hypothetical protein ACKOEQ_08035 [Verrucomicrobiota bacterium]